MLLEQQLYAQVVTFRRRESEDIKEKDMTKQLTSKDNWQQNNIGLILITNG